jgi:hypothetical protein
VKQPRAFAGVVRYSAQATHTQTQLQDINKMSALCFTDHSTPVVCCLQAIDRACEWLYCSDEGGIKRIEICSGIVSTYAGDPNVAAAAEAATFWHQTLALLWLCKPSRRVSRRQRL